MRAFFLEYRSAEEDLAPPVRDLDIPELPAADPNLPWSHRVVLIAETFGGEERGWYAERLKDPCHLEFFDVGGSVGPSSCISSAVEQSLRAGRET